MGSHKLKPSARKRRIASRPRKVKADSKPTAVVPFRVVPTGHEQSRADRAAADLASLHGVIERQADEITNLREAVRQQMESLTAIATAAPSLSETVVRESTLHDAQATLAHALEVIGQVLGPAPSGAALVGVVRPEPVIDPFVRAKQHRVPYDHLKSHVSKALAAVAPDDAVVMVVSRGDDSLMQNGNRRMWHFPQNDDGIYAGYHPASSRHAIRHLESLREKGGQFLVFPATAAWWLDHYGELRRHLEQRYRLVYAEPDACAIYDVRLDRQGDQS
jgi:hypothetical protein